MTQPIRIGNAQAFWGDRSDAAARLLSQEPELDYLTMDYLAEVSMSILARQRERDSAAGFPHDFIDVVRSLVPYWNWGGRCKLIANAGGLNPQGCARACQKALGEAGSRALKIGVVTGDDVLESIRTSDTSRNLDTCASIEEVRSKLVTANAYLGAEPIVMALDQGADIVITGRVADPSLVVASCWHHFGWKDDDLAQLAGATVAGHLIECGTQVTGGISTDWLSVPDPVHLGFPIVEVSEDGSCIVTKPQHTGGQVTPWTVKEQLVYEIGDPAHYLSPDVTVSFLSLNVEDLGNNRVQVRGATGLPRPETYKVSATYRDGFRAAGTLTITGRDAVSKARRCGQIVLQRIHEAGFTLRDALVECLGAAEGVPSNSSPNIHEVVLRIAVEADQREAVEYFSRELMPLITGGPQGITGYAEGRPRVHPVFRYWPCLINRQVVSPEVTWIDCPGSSSASSALPWKRQDSAIASTECPVPGNSISHSRRTLYDIAQARSGDKGIHANVGVIARNSQAWKFLRNWLTAERVAEFYAPLEVDSVARYELPNLEALNFVLHGVLRRSLRTDAQGKALGQMLLELPLPEEELL